MKKGLAIFETVCTKAVCFIAFAFAFAFAHWAGKYTHAYPLDYAYEIIFEYADSRKTNIAILAAVVLLLFLAGKLFIRGEQEKKHKIVKIIALVEVGLIGGSLANGLFDLHARIVQAKLAHSVVLRSVELGSLLGEGSSHGQGVGDRIIVVASHLSSHSIITSFFYFKVVSLNLVTIL